jgi:hypothetical protein
MHNLAWPPELDAIKIEQACVQGRIRGTEIWMELDLTNPVWREGEHSKEVSDAIIAWLSSFG